MDFDDNRMFSMLVGEYGAHLKVIESRFGVELHQRGLSIRIRPGGEVAQRVARALEQVYGLIHAGIPVGIAEIRHSLGILEAEEGADLHQYFTDTIVVGARNRRITPRTLGQREYVTALRTHDVVFGVGPAGTGKTYLAVCMAAAALSKGEVKRIILTRPAVEAGEKLGFLPGDLNEKIDPYIRPLQDALNDMFSREKVERLMEKGQIEIVPLAFMRGRTLEDAYVILDEAQNTTIEQMKMFLTRLGVNSKAVITGDETQIDLPRGAASGLTHAIGVLEHIERIQLCRFGISDVVRHPLVADVIAAYEASGHGRQR